MKIRCRGFYVTRADSTDVLEACMSMCRFLEALFGGRPTNSTNPISGIKRCLKPDSPLPIVFRPFGLGESNQGILNKN